MNDALINSPEWLDTCRQLLAEPFPPDVIDEKNGLLYVPHEMVRDRLIAATGNCFDWSIDQVLFRDDGVTRRANDRYTGEPKRPLSMIVLGTLTIPGLGSRSGIGAHPLDEGAGEDAAYKSAESDALKRAAMAFGVGLRQLYIETGEAKRVQKPTRQSRSTQPAKGPKPLSDAQFTKEVRTAVHSKDAALVRTLAEQANDHIGRWVALIQAAESLQSLDWIKRQIDKKGIQSDVIAAELAKREAAVKETAVIA